MQEYDPQFESEYRHNGERSQWDTFNGDGPSDRGSRHEAAQDWYDRNERRHEAHLQHRPSHAHFEDTYYQRPYGEREVFDPDINRTAGRHYPNSWREGSRFSDREQDYRGGHWDRTTHSYHDGDGREREYRRGWQEYENPESSEYANFSGGSTEHDYSQSNPDVGYAAPYDNRFGRGAFAGIAPKNYQRSDARIEEDICERLTAHSQIDPSGLEVKVVQGEVILTGEVPTRRMKRIAEDLADEIPGVRDVNNQLHVREQHSNETGMPQSHYVALHSQTRPS